MSQSITLDVKGLYTYPSDTSGVPLGSASVALNLNINRRGVVESRRGFGNLTYALPNSSDRLKKLLFWQDSKFGHYGTTFGYYNPASGWTSLGSITLPTNSTSISTVSSQNKNLYLATSSGLYKTDAISTAVYAAGVPKALTIDLSVAGAGTAIANNYWATYQCMFGRKDANSNIQYGGVSGTFDIQNVAGSTQNVTARCYLPSGLDTSYFIQLYRTYTATTTPSAIGPQQCYEISLSSTNISNGYVDITDVVPDAQLGATIYTDSSQQGISQDNALPPAATDIAEFKGYMFYSDIQFKHQFQLNLLGVGGTSFVAGDTITIVLGGTTEVYTGHATVFNSSIKQFVVSTGGSVSQNIDATIKSFIKCVNLASSLVQAYSVPYSALNPFPGKLSLESKSLATGSFTVTSTRPAAFQPQLPSPAVASNTSTADSFKNGIAISKAGFPEAVPRAQVIKVGASDDRILRIQALRDGLLIYKQRGGVYVLRGNSITDFQTTLLDATAKLVAPDSLAIVNNTAFGLFEAGICRVDDNSVAIISDRIKDQILPLFGTALAQLKSYSFGFGSDTDGKYVLSIPQASTDTYTKRQIVYDLYNDTFVNWNLSLTCGGIDPTDQKINLGQGASNYILQEKRNFDYTDFADTFQSACTITSYVGTTVYVNNLSNMAIGDILEQPSSSSLAYIEAINSTTGSVTVDVAQSWTLNTATVNLLRAIDCKWQWNPDTGGAPSGLKQYYECALIQKQAFQKTASLIFSSDINPAETTISLLSSSGNGAFGSFDFGQEVFGGDQARAPKRLGVPRGQARCNQLNVRFETKVAYNDFQLTGLSLSFNPSSTRTTR